MFVTTLFLCFNGFFARIITSTLDFNHLFYYFLG